VPEDATQTRTEMLEEGKESRAGGWRALMVFRERAEFSGQEDRRTDQRRSQAYAVSVRLCVAQARLAVSCRGDCKQRDTSMPTRRVVCTRYWTISPSQIWQALPDIFDPSRTGSMPPAAALPLTRDPCLSVPRTVCYLDRLTA